jgi:hypothetical protein
MVQNYLRPAAIKAGVIKEDERVRCGFHNFRHSLASSLVKLKCDPKTVQGVLRHEDVRTTMQLYAQSDQESRLEAQGKFLALLLGDKAHLLTGHSVTYLGPNLGPKETRRNAQVLWNDGGQGRS